MPSTFTWLDYSEHERRQMLDVIELFGERTTRDELGLGGVRDAFVDLLFPGTSTIQTRAKYFLFVPWIYLVLEQNRNHIKDVSNRVRKLETELMRAIEDSDDKSGLIGRRAKENVLRLPSSVYWQGLAVWGIRLFGGSQDEYYDTLRQAHRSSRHEFDGESSVELEMHNWHPGLPRAPHDFPQAASFALKRHEAGYLRERVLTHCPESLLAYLIRERIPVANVSYAWDLAARVPESLRESLQHGRNFSETMLAAQLLYNLMLAELRAWQEKIDEYRGKLSEWWFMMAQRGDDLQNWDRRKFWQIVFRGNPRVSSRAKRFVNQWIDLVLAAKEQSDAVEKPAARQLVAHREQQLKGGLARLHNERARELWPGAAGAGQIDLRWGKASGIIADILVALKGDGRA